MSVVSLPHPPPTNGRPGERLDNRTAGRRGRQIACAWQTWQGYYLGYYVRILSWSSLTSMFSGLLQKDLFKGKWSLAKSYFKQNHCHACHTRFAVFFPLPSCCVSSRIFLKRFRFTFTPNGKREFAPRDQVSPLIVVYCLLLLPQNK